MTTTTPREELLQVRMTTGEITMLRELAELEGSTASATVRALVRRAHAAEFGRTPSKPKRTAKARKS